VQVTYFHRKPRPNANYSIELVFENLRRELAGQIDAEICVAPCRSNGLLRRLWIVWHAGRHQGELNHVTGDTNFTALGLDRRRTILTSHDCGFVKRTRGWRRRILKKFWLDMPVARVAAVTTVSSQVKREIVEYTGCDPDKVYVIHNAASPAFRPAPLRFNAARPRILHVGTAANKNLERLIDAVAGTPCTLVIVGAISPDIVRRLAAAKVDYENYVDLETDELVRQYELCDIVAFLSLYEGFGVPILEAHAVGRPLITSQRLPMSEVAGIGACLVNPKNVSEIRGAIDRICADANYRQGLVEAGFENIQRFAPKRIAEQYFELYRNVLAGASPGAAAASRTPAPASLSLASID
jgi:glycosyltransferase involved in cell wall biosynthesis